MGIPWIAAGHRHSIRNSSTTLGHVRDRSSLGEELPQCAAFVFWRARPTPIIRSVVTAAECPFNRRAQASSEALSDIPTIPAQPQTMPMTTLNLDTLRRAAAAFVAPRSARHQVLAPASELIAELRQKQASYTAIAELLTQHGLPVRKTAIANFCHEVLGEARKRRSRGHRTAVARRAT